MSIRSLHKMMLPPRHNKNKLVSAQDVDRRTVLLTRKKRGRKRHKVKMRENYNTKI